MEPLKYVSESVVDSLQANIAQNVKRYESGDFSDFSDRQGWGLELKTVTYDPSFVEKLDPSNASEAEIANSLLVHGALLGMTPAIAREERAWVRLCHLEGLEYARERWIGKDTVKSVDLHFFARTLDQCRDDNALGRLWWNGHIANLIDPSDPERVLRQLLRRANIRLQFFDRSNALFRMPLAKGIVRLLEKEDWLNSHDRAFEVYMLVMDKHSGGRLFETLPENEIDDHLAANLPMAQAVFEERYGD